MGQFYIDDSVHDEAGFIVAACVYTNVEIDIIIKEIIKSSGFDSETFEYKSCANYSKEPEKTKVRDQLKLLLYDSCYLGLVIVPRTKREELGIECLKAIKQFVEANEKVKKPVGIYVDEGMFSSIKKANKLIDSLGLDDCTFYLEQNSMKIKGIQLADLAAHISSIQLKDTLGLVTKRVKIEEDSGYGSEMEMELGFEMWATLRYSFFNEGSKESTDDPIADATLKVEPYGLYISNHCDSKLSEIARSTFGDIYLGCIH